jgi:heme oxygenase
MLILLELETRPFHAELDRPWLELRNDRVSPTDYARHLCEVYGFVSPLEAAIAYTPGMTAYVDIRRHAHAGIIAQDLLALGLGPGRLSAVPQCPLVPFGDPLEALGWLFCRERARRAKLGLDDHLRSAFEFAHDPCGYLATSTAAFDADWTRLGKLLDTHVRGSTTETIVVEAARAAHERAVAWRDEIRLSQTQRTA